MGRSLNLNSAKQARFDEFYTLEEDVAAELKHYGPHFENQVVYLNCDDPKHSAFWKYFDTNFDKLKLKRLLATHYDNTKPVHLWEKDRHHLQPTRTLLEGDGDFRSNETQNILRQANIVVTNPPFSLFKEHVTNLISASKKFLIVGPMTAVTYKDVFPLIRDEKMWLGANPAAGSREGNSLLFAVPNHYDGKTFLYDGKRCAKASAWWYTNLEHSGRRKPLHVTATYHPNVYPTYDNYHAIEVPRVQNIPQDYDGAMGVPITYLKSHQPDQFNIVGITQAWDKDAGYLHKTYGPQTQVNPSGEHKNTAKLNSGAAIKTDVTPTGTTYYQVGDETFVKPYVRILIEHRKEPATDQ